MKRITEPELMERETQARAYAFADFSEPHSLVMEHFVRCMPNLPKDGAWVDLGCGDAEMTVRLAKLCPAACIDAVDGSQAMIRYAKRRLLREGIIKQMRIIIALIAEMPVDGSSYDGIFSNSLLHHLHNPQVLWEAIKRIAKNNARIFVSDLYRPKSKQQVEHIVERYAGSEPKILQRDFRNSLHAAFTPNEIKKQLEDANLSYLQTEIISDRHCIVFGRLRQK